MEVIKKNLFNIIFAVIALLAVGRSVLADQRHVHESRPTASARLDTSSKLDQVSNQSRNMPLLDPNQTTADPLEVFPIQTVIDAGTAATAKVSEQAKNMMDFATKTNSHLPLQPDELPKPSEGARFNFATVYANSCTNYQRWIDIVDSTSPPSPADVDAEKAKLKDEIDKARLVYDANNNVDATSQQGGDGSIYRLNPRLCSRAWNLSGMQQHRVYLLLPPTFNPLPVDKDIKVQSYLSPEEICRAQVIVWVLDDVMNGIKQANELYSDPATPGGPPQHDIFHSAVKSIEGVDPPQPAISPNAGDFRAPAAAATPKVPAVSPTGRVCNGLYDALRFKVRLVVDASKVPEIVRSLEAGQFITVVNVQLTEMVDPAVAAANPQGGLHFGNKPVVRAEFDCEELLMRKWTDALFPDSLKGGLGKGSASALRPTTAAAHDPHGPMGPGGPYGPGGPGGPGYGPPPP